MESYLLLTRTWMGQLVVAYLVGVYTNLRFNRILCMYVLIANETARNEPV